VEVLQKRSEGYGAYSVSILALSSPPQLVDLKFCVS